MCHFPGLCVVLKKKGQANEYKANMMVVHKGRMKWAHHFWAFFASFSIIFGELDIDMIYKS